MNKSVNPIVIAVAVLILLALTAGTYLIVKRARGGPEPSVPFAEKQKIERRANPTGQAVVSHINPNLPPDVPRLAIPAGRGGRALRVPGR